MTWLTQKFRLYVQRYAFKIGNWASGYTYEPRCPYCDNECGTDDHNEWFDGDVDEIECFNCGKYFDRFVNVDITWYTEPKDDVTT